MAQPEKLNYQTIIENMLANQDTTQMETPLEPKQNQENLMKASELWKISRVSERHKNFKPEHSKSTVWSEKFSALSGRLGTGFIALIIGTRGAGKSQLAACAIRSSCKNLRSALYVKAFDFFLSIRSTYSKESSIKTEEGILKEFSSPSLLVIDAIENRSDSPFENMLLNHLVDTRYDSKKDTILIGNLDEISFAASMGPSIVDRIHECGVKIVCNWKSFR